MKNFSTDDAKSTFNSHRGCSQLLSFPQVYKRYAFPDPLPHPQCTTNYVDFIIQKTLFRENIHESFLIL